MNRLLTVLVFGLTPATLLRADFVSYAGTLTSPTDVVEETFTLSSPAAIGLQTWGFGGGANAAGNAIAPGGTDPFLAIFSSSGAILTDGFADPGTPVFAQVFVTAGTGSCRYDLAGYFVMY